MIFIGLKFLKTEGSRLCFIKLRWPDLLHISVVKVTGDTERRQVAFDRTGYVSLFVSLFGLPIRHWRHRMRIVVIISIWIVVILISSI